jgi:endoglucanase Acf2
MGSYGTTTDPPYTPKQTAAVTTKMPTNDWWTSLAWNYYGDNYSGELYADPLSFKAQYDGLRVRYQRNAEVQAYRYHYDNDTGIPTDFIVTVKGLNATSARVDGFSDWAVRADWNDGTRNLKATIGHGFPYAYFTLSGDMGGIYFFTAPSASWGGGDAIGVTVNGSHYGIFIPTGSNWNFFGQWWESNLGGKNYMAICALPDNTVATLNYYKSHAFAFITNTTVTWNYNQATSVLTSTFTATVTPMEAGQTTALMALYRHQWLNSSAINTTYSYSPTARGEMKVMRGNSFSTQMKFNGVLPALAPVMTGAAYNTNLNNYINTAIAGPTGGDTYNAGKWLGRLAQLVQLAEQQGAATSAQFTTFLNAMRNELQDWFTVGGKEFRYNNTWGTLIGYPASFGSNTILNDHHFHYGYFVMAAAIVARYDQAWASTATGWGNMVELLIKDVANWDIAADPRFPKLRNFDPYAGHSWANGHGAGWNGNDQESTSEAINFATGCILWGTMTCNTAIRDLGIFLYTNEVAAIEQYWFDVDNVVFPAAYNLAMVSILNGNGGQYAIHWDPPGNNVTELHGIQLLPITGGSLYLGRNPSYINTFLQEMHSGSDVGGINGVWRDIFWGMEALTQSGTFNAAAAVARFNANSGYTPEVGESKAHTYHWINNLNTMGQLHPTITGNIPTSAVFIKGSNITYVAYNPPCNGTITVTFSNGACMQVAPNELKYAVNLIDCGTLPVQIEKFYAEVDQGNVILHWITSSEDNNSHFEIERSNDLEKWSFIGTVNASGNASSVHSYQFIDREPENGISYYRLRQIDLDGSFHYSHVVSVEIEKGTSFGIYPNPASEYIIVSGLNRKGINRIEVFNSEGRMVKEFLIENGSGISTSFSVKELEPGIYFIRIYQEALTIYDFRFTIVK